MQFNQTRGVIDKLREKVERSHLMIVHMRAQLDNYNEQLEIMNTIAAHSALQVCRPLPTQHTNSKAFQQGRFFRRERPSFVLPFAQSSPL